ncbi:MAG: monomethylamine:corrinoid methyltransferase [Candidatus Methanomethylophilaceae archaeon]
MDTLQSLSIIDVYDRFCTGRKMSEDYWDYSLIPENASRMKERYRISFGGNIIPEDEDLLDRLFEAGCDMLTETGFYCPDMGRALRVTRDEIDFALDEVPVNVPLGHGRDTVILEPRRMGSKKGPTVIGGPSGSLVSEELYTGTMISYAQERCIDALFDGAMNIPDADTYPDSPREMYSVIKEIRYSEMARMNAGRPGMCIVGPESSLTIGSRILANLPNGGMRTSDAHNIPQRNELKIDAASLNMLAAAKINGNIIMVEGLPILGGYCGGVEETSICEIASAIASFVLFGAHVHSGGPIHIKYGATTARETLQAHSHSLAALDRNTDALTGSMFYVASGPCTEMCFLENAAQAVVATVSGAEVIETSASCKGAEVDRATGKEARFAAKASQAAAGLTPEEGNAIMEELLGLYEKDLGNAPYGMSFRECYDPITGRPTEEHLRIYEDTVTKVRGLGPPMRY